MVPVVLKSQASPAERPRQGRPPKAARRPQDRARSITYAKDLRRCCCQTYQDVGCTLPIYPPTFKPPRSDTDAWNRNLVLTMFQPRPPQIHCPRPHLHQHTTTHTASHPLQRQEISTAGSASEEDKGDQETIDEAGGDYQDREAKEKANALSAKEICCQGTQNMTTFLKTLRAL